jgi:hypothetical protein
MKNWATRTAYGHTLGHLLDQVEIGNTKRTTSEISPDRISVKGREPTAWYGMMHDPKSPAGLSTCDEETDEAE